MILAGVTVALTGAPPARAAVIAGPALPVDAHRPLLVARPDGSLVALWQRKGAVVAAVKPTAWDRFRRPAQIAALPGDYTATLRLVGAPDGHIAAAWTTSAEGHRGGALRVSLLEPRGGTWSAPQLLAGDDAAGGVLLAELAFTADGALTAAWVTPDMQCDGVNPCTLANPLYERTLTPAGSWSPPRLISSQAGDVLMSLSASPDGSLTAGWSNGPGKWVTRRTRGDEVWSPRTRLFSSGTGFTLENYDLPLATASDGTTVAAWSRFLASQLGALSNDLFVAVRAANQTAFDAPLQLASHTDANVSFEPKLAVDGQSRFTLLVREPDGERTRIVSYTSAPGATNWRRQTVVDDVGIDDAYRLTVGADGRAVCLFERSGAAEPYKPRLYLSVRDAAGAWSAPSPLSTTPQDTDSSQGSESVGGEQGPAAAFDSRGDLTVVWQDRDRPRTAVMLRRRVKPTLALAVPRRVGAGRRVRVRLKVSAGFLPATGTAAVYRDGRRVTRIRMSGPRTVTIRLARLSAGWHTVTARFRGRGRLSQARPASVRIRVEPR